MKKLLTIAGLMLLSICVFAQTTEVQVVLKENTPNKYQRVYMFRVEDGGIKQMKSAVKASDGSFVFSFEPAQEGFYMIGGYTAYAGQFPIYLKKGDQANVKIENRKLEFIGNQTEENTVLSSWNKLSVEIKSQPFNFNLVKTKMEAFQKSSIHTKNRQFNLLMQAFVGYDIGQHVLALMERNETLKALNKDAGPNQDLAEYCKYLFAGDKLMSDNVFYLPNGKDLIVSYGHYAASINKAVFSTNRQKGTYVFNTMGKRLKSYSQFEDMMTKHGVLFQYSSLKAEVDALGAKLYSATPGRKGANFSFPDQDGKMVSLSDFKGKVVLVDVWATYCGPCKALIPALNNLEKELHSKDIVFVSVAQDGPRGKDTWLKMIKEKQMSGVQLFAGGANNILSNQYKIKVMPRFLIFDRKGNVVTTEAPHPDSPALKKLLLAALDE